MRALCVSIHDVAPSTWEDCRRVISAVQQVAPLPLTLLVVPHWHRLPQSGSAGFFAALNIMRQSGHELALHGYTHLDEGPPPRTPLAWFRRRILTRSEGEFSALDQADAQDRLQCGLSWFARQGWHPQGFVAPAWMMSAASFAALGATGLSYATGFGGLVLLPQYQTVPAPALVYSARHAAGDGLVRFAMSVRAARQQQAPLLRLALHPADAHRPATLRHAQRLLADALTDREAMTKAEVAKRLREMH
jgi:predicted deacetylase